MSNNTTPNGDKNSKEPKNRQSMIMFAVFMLVGILVWSFLQKSFTDATTKQISYSEFVAMLEEDRISKVEETYKIGRAHV